MRSAIAGATVQGAWHTVHRASSTPVALNDDKNFADDEDLARQVRDMRETRREEGFADLVGLAWTQTHHPSQYAPVYAWLARLRNEQPVAGAITTPARGFAGCRRRGVRHGRHATVRPGIAAVAAGALESRLSRRTPRCKPLPT